MSNLKFRNTCQICQSVPWILVWSLRL